MAEEAAAPTSAPPCWSNILKQKPSPDQHNPAGVLSAAADRVFVDGCKSTKGIAVAVIDATAIIQGGEKLVNCSDKFVSVSEVMDEVRDPVSRHRLNFVPFTVETREPSPESFKKVINFARATGDLQTLSDVDLKLIALTYTLETQIHGTTHLRDIPPPIHMVNVKSLPEKDMPGWGSNVPNLEEWEALDAEPEDRSNPNSRILPLKDLDMNGIPNDQNDSAQENEDADDNFRKPRKYVPQKKEVVNIEGKKMVADGIDASQGQLDDNAGDWLPAVSRSTHRKYLRRKAKREMYEVLSQKDSQQDAVETIERNNTENEIDQLAVKNSEETCSEEKNAKGDLSTILNQMQLGENSSKVLEEESNQCSSCAGLESNTSTPDEAMSGVDEDSERTEMSSQTNDNLNAYVDDSCSEQSWMLRSLSESSVACVTSDFAMQNVLLQMGLRLLAPGGMQIRQLHRWILKCHACFKVTTEIGRIFCPSCGNGGTLRKVAVTVGENGLVLAARRPRISLRGTQFSLPLPKGGRDGIAKNPILREDQLPQKFLYPNTKKKKNKQVDDIFASDDIFSHHSDRRAPLQPPIRKAMAVFSGKRNPNDNHFSRSKRG